MVAYVLVILVLGHPTSFLQGRLDEGLGSLKQPRPPPELIRRPRQMRQFRHGTRVVARARARPPGNVNTDGPHPPLPYRVVSIRQCTPCSGGFARVV